MTPLTTRSTEAAAFESDLRAILETVPRPITRLARRLIRLLMADHPDLTPVVRVGWRSVNFRHPQARFICGVFPLADRVSLVFEHGRLLDNAAGLLQGDNLKQVRFIPFCPGDRLPMDEIGVLVAEAIAHRS